MKPQFQVLLMVAVLAILAATVHADATPARETRKFTLYKWQVKKGDERITIETNNGVTTVTSAFGFTDRNRTVPFSAILTLDNTGSPTHFRAWGMTSRGTETDATVTRQGADLLINVDGKTSTVKAPTVFFVGAGYAPAAMTEQLLRYWRTHGEPALLPVFPVGDVAIIRRGQDSVNDDDGHPVKLDRYQVKGLEWGRETVWLDPEGKLAAIKCVDAEFDHFEATAKFTEGLGKLVASAGADGMVSLADSSRAFASLVDKDAAMALVGGTVIDATGAAPISDAVVIVKGDRIVDVGPRERVKIPDGVRQVDVTGKTLLPGLWDMHAHFEQVEWGPIYLAAGVTTVRDCGNEPDFIAAVRDSVAANTGLGPRLLLACLIDGPGKYAIGVGSVNSAAEIPAAVKRMKDGGCVQAKIYSSMRPELVKPLAKAAHAAGMTVTGHIPGGMAPMQAIDDGMDMVNHLASIAPAFYAAGIAVDVEGPARDRAVLAIDVASPASKKFIAALAKRKIVVDPTIALDEAFNHTGAEMFALEPGLAKVAQPLAGPLSSMGIAEKEKEKGHKIFAKQMEILRALHAAGVIIVAGTDQLVPGHSLRRELELYVDAGFTPLEAIQAATIVPARAMKREKDLGTIEKGKIADLIVVDGDPLKDIRALRRVVTVITGGRAYDAAKLWTLADFKP